MDPAIEKALERQSALEAAKAAFFASGGQAQLIPTGVGKDSPGVVQAPKPAYGYRTIEAQKSKRGRVIGDEDRAALAAQLMECKAAGMTRYKASRHLEISETLCRRLIADFSLDFPASA
ncbi:hypothetical protein [Pseudomonas vancouverensis]|uniref:Uncharacterized protein n=1 Tax=Pseudomonas vancouverensis TaxID=95300 RepID=A0A1H2MVR8_PSEVA|nr:hypothetical protein [Pseudomonas vancouverensis]KAB0489727.1 hypothetical protein F7R09_28845 [Pseudomonas vancouverensis]TDB67223.1 hypothetical protein EIY72_04015 [Pseudomonas vancouverensis]SDU96656.1 hypothetical protein SAMN05216558_1267 [Pseudomonas vancouverensis]